jgi:hypothetical protein
MSRSIRSTDIIGNFCICCWVALTDDNWFQSYKTNGHKRCKLCFGAPKTLPPDPSMLKIPQCSKCSSNLDSKNWANYNKEHNTHICNECNTKRAYNFNIILKQYAIEAYGNKCICCDEDHIDMLTIDHINNDGASHRKTNNIKTGQDTYQWLKQQNYPQNEFRTLCWSCNFSYGHYGYCPHNIDTIKILTNPTIISNIQHNKDHNICRYCATSLNSTNISNIYMCKDCKSSSERFRNRNIKINTMNAYGGQKCVCCGDEHIEFLTLDHIFEDGIEHKRKLGIDRKGGSSFYKALKKAGYPDKDRLRVLCFNCNCARSICGNGTCPHEEERQHKAFLTNSHSFLTRAATND